VSEQRVIAVVVTWNRRSLLEESLTAIAAQSHPVEATVVVDNASDDGTATMLAEKFPHVHVVSTGRNVGGAGGFAIGLDRALRRDVEAVWLMDDDTVPHHDALEALVWVREEYRAEQGSRWAVAPPALAPPALAPPALVASRVVWTDGRDHPMNTPRPKFGASSVERASARRVGCTPIRTASFVSVLVDAASASEVGLPVADYFLWNDDFEFTARLLRGRRGLSCPASVVVHKTAKFGGTQEDPGERFYLEVRNKVWLFGRTTSLSVPEKVLYGAATLRRWAGTVARSHRRRVLVRGLGRGVWDGLRAGPRPTSTVTAEALAVNGEVGRS
jgi:GT2 family glycosyltransferase